MLVLRKIVNVRFFHGLSYKIGLAKGGIFPYLLIFEYNRLISLSIVGNKKGVILVAFICAAFLFVMSLGSGKSWVLFWLSGLGFCEVCCKTL